MVQATSSIEKDKKLGQSKNFADLAKSQVSEKKVNFGGFDEREESKSSSPSPSQSYSHQKLGNLLHG